MRPGTFFVLVAIQMLPVRAHANPFPTAGADKPMRIIVTTAAGSGIDQLTRPIAEKLGQRIGRAVVVDNRPGANGAIGVNVAAEGVPDGMTLVSTSNSFVINGVLKRFPYDIRTTFAPVAQISSQYYMALCPVSLPVNSFAEMLDYARKNPGKITFGSAGAGGASHLAAEVFQKSTGTRFVHVPYKGILQAFNDVMAGHVDMMFGFEASVGPHMHGGKVRVLAVTGAKRHPALPNVPAVSEVVPGYVMVSWATLVAPPGTPVSVVQKLSAATVEVMRMPEVIERIRLQGYEVVGTNAAATKTQLRQEAERWRKIVPSLGIKPE